MCQRAVLVAVRRVSITGSSECFPVGYVCVMWYTCTGACRCVSQWIKCYVAYMYV